MAERIINILGHELKSNFFVFLSEKTSIDIQQLCLLWDQYFGDDGSPIEARSVPVSSPSPSPKATSKKPKTTKSPKEKTDCLTREEQTSIKLNEIEKMKVADLRKYNKERGIRVTGTKADLVEYLTKYEQKYEQNNEDGDEEIVEPQKKKTTKKDSESKPTGVADPKPKSKTKKTPKSVETIQVEEIEVENDEYGYKIIDGDLVCDEENGEMIVVGFKDEKGDVVHLTREHVDRCKELNVRFNSDEVE